MMLNGGTRRIKRHTRDKSDGLGMVAGTKSKKRYPRTKSILGGR